MSCPRCGAPGVDVPLAGHTCIRNRVVEAVRHHPDVLHHHRALVPAGLPDFHPDLQPLVNVTISVGLEVTYDGRPGVVCVPPRYDDLGPRIGEPVLIRYLDGGRERVLVNPYDVAVGIDL